MLRGPRPAAARNPVRTAALPTRLAASLVVAPLAVIGLVGCSTDEESFLRGVVVRVVVSVVVGGIDGRHGGVRPDALHRAVRTRHRG